MDKKGLAIIETQRYGPFFSVKLDSDVNTLKKKGTVINIIEQNKYNSTLWYCTLDKTGILNDNFHKSLPHYLSDTIASFIMDIVRPSVLEDIMQRNYSYFNKSEREIILRLTLHKLINKNDKGRYLYDKSYIVKEMLKYFQENQYVNLEGFFFFRLKRILADLRSNVEATIDDFLMEQEYQDFIKLLKYFVTLQEPKTELINLTMDKEGNFQIRDNEFRILEHGYSNNEVCLSLFNSIMPQDDLLINSLINFAPQKIIVHQVLCQAHPKVVEAIINIFGGRVIVCKNCKFCLEQKISF